MLKMIDFQIQKPAHEFVGHDHENLAYTLLIETNTGDNYIYYLECWLAGKVVRSEAAVLVDSVLHIDLTEEILHAQGVARAQIVGLYGEQVRKSNIFYLRIGASVNAAQCLPPVDADTFREQEIRMMQYLSEAEAAEAAASSAAQTATSAVIHGPFISLDGYWQVWDFTQECYVDTGVYAKGLAPIRGVDYWTAADKAYIVDEAAALTAKPYTSLRRLGDYIYEVTFAKLPEANSVTDGFVPSGCSSYVKDGKLYRNLDWNYDHGTSFHIICPGFEAMSFDARLTDTALSDDIIGQLPYRLVDGRNQYDIMVSTHVLYNDWDIVGNGDVPLTKLPYIVLSQVKSMATIEEDLGDILENLYVPEAMATMEYLIQVLVTDGVTTYCLMPDITADGKYIAVDITANPKLANFLWVEDATVVRAQLQRRPTGVERWNMMPYPLEELRFTAAYESSDRLSEFIGIDDTGKDSTDAELLMQRISTAPVTAYCGRPCTALCTGRRAWSVCGCRRIGARTTSLQLAGSAVANLS